MKRLLLEIHGMKFYTDNTVRIESVGSFTWMLLDETIYISNGDQTWPIDMSMCETSRCHFYSELYYAIAEYELLK